MNVEVYSYSLFTTVLGMLVVFLSLSALSVMMVVLKRIFSGEGKKSGGKRAQAIQSVQRKAGKAEQGGSGQQMPVWVPAAVAAYLTEEQEPDRPSADPWNAVVNQYDPWITARSFSKRGV